MANVYPLRNSKPQMQCLGCGEISDAPCECNVGWKAIVDELQEDIAKRREQTRQRTAKTRQKAKQNQRSGSATSDNVVTFDDLQEDCEDCKDATEQWQRSLDNFAGHALSMRPLWKKLFGEWEQFDVPKSTLILAEQAAAEWAEVVRHLKSRR